MSFNSAHDFFELLLLEKTTMMWIEIHFSSLKGSVLRRTLATNQIHQIAYLPVIRS